jgi:hypothetical protein
LKQFKTRPLRLRKLVLPLKIKELVLLCTPKPYNSFVLEIFLSTQLIIFASNKHVIFFVELSLLIGCSTMVEPIYNHDIVFFAFGFDLEANK